MSRAQHLGFLAVVLGLLALTGCGGEERTPAPAPTASSPSESDSTSAPEPSESTAEPSTGKEMAVAHAVARAPEGWSVEKNAFGLLTASDPAASQGMVFLSDLGTVGAGSPRELARVTELATFTTRPDVAYDGELAGVPAYRATAHEPPLFVEEYGALRDGAAVVLTFKLFDTMPAGKRARLVESVLASFGWR